MTTTRQRRLRCKRPARKLGESGSPLPISRALFSAWETLGSETGHVKAAAREETRSHRPNPRQETTTGRLLQLVHEDLVELPHPLQDRIHRFEKRHILERVAV